MIRFRQKEFSPALLAGLLTPTNLLIGGTTIASMKQSSDQAKEAEEQAERTKEALDRQTKALNKIAKEAKNNPELAQQVVAQKNMSWKIKRFAALNPGTLKNLGGFAKDVWNTQKGNIGKTAKLGLGFGAIGWAGNRIATSLRDNDEGRNDQNKNFLKKAALGAAAVGTAYTLARKGKLGAASKPVESGFKFVGKAVNPISRDAKTGKISKLGTGINATFIGMPVLGYLGQRKQQEDQAAQTQERGYSDSESHKLRNTALGLGATALGILGARRGIFGAKTQKITGNLIANTGGILKSAGIKAGDKIAKSGAQTYAAGFRDKRGRELVGNARKAVENNKYLKATEPNKISSGVSNIGSFVGFYGKGGTKAVQNTGKKLAESKNEISQKVGKWIQENPGKANIGAGVGSVAIGMPLMAAGSKPFEVADKHAYDYEKQQNQHI